MGAGSSAPPARPTPAEPPAADGDDDSASTWSGVDDDEEEDEEEDEVAEEAKREFARSAPSTTPAGLVLEMDPVEMAKRLLLVDRQLERALATVRARRAGRSRRPGPSRPAPAIAKRPRKTKQ